MLVAFTAGLAAATAKELIDELDTLS